MPDASEKATHGIARGSIEQSPSVPSAEKLKAHIRAILEKLRTLDRAASDEDHSEH